MNLNKPFTVSILTVIMAVGFIDCSRQKSSSIHRVAQDQDTLPKAEDAIPVIHRPSLDTGFLAYVASLPVVKLPFETNCKTCCRHPEVDDENPLVLKYKPEGAAIMGVLSQTADRVVILFTYPADTLVPSIWTYDTEGNVRDRQDFMGGFCGG